MSRRFLAAAAAFSVCVLLSGCDKEKPTAPALQATCSAQPGSGAAPLPVAFALTVAGAEGPFRVTVNYGDGTSASSADETHTYAAAGSYVASFTISTATQSARCATTVAVGAPPANQPPIPVYKTVPDAQGRTLSGRAPYSVRFNECATSDPENDRLWYSMDFNGDGRFDSSGPTGAACRQDHVFPAGTFFPRVCVHDVDADNQPLHPDECLTYTVVATP